MSAVRDALLRAAALVEAGWVQGRDEDVVDGQPCFCAGGAISAATQDTDVVFEPDEALMAVLTELGYGGVGIVAWNDAPDRTQAEVVAALRTAAERVA